LGYGLDVAGANTLLVEVMNPHSELQVSPFSFVQYNAPPPTCDWVHVPAPRRQPHVLVEMPTRPLVPLPLFCTANEGLAMSATIAVIADIAIRLWEQFTYSPLAATKLLRHDSLVPMTTNVNAPRSWPLSPVR